MDAVLHRQAGLRFGFIGCGTAARYHAEVVRALGHEVAAVAAREGSPRLTPFARDYPAVRSYTDWKKMLSQECLDALVLAVSWDQTGQLAAEVIRSAVPVLIEKPLALNAQKVQEILRQAGASQVCPYSRVILAKARIDSRLRGNDN